MSTFERPSETSHERSCEKPPLDQTHIQKKISDKREELWQLLESDGPCTKKVAACKCPEDFLMLFRAAGITGDEWQSSAWLHQQHHTAIYNAILHCQRWESWKSFVSFVCEAEIRQWAGKLKQCPSPQDFLRLFGEMGIPDEEWKSIYWLRRNGFAILESAIVDDGRWKSWQKFVKFLERKEPLGERVARCRKPADFQKLLWELEIGTSDWHRTSWLEQNGYKFFYRVVMQDGRWNTWDQFIRFMVPKKYAKLIAQCIEPNDFISLFATMGISGNAWVSSGNLRSSGFPGLEGSIKRDGRWNSWEDFLRFMGMEVRENVAEKIRACQTPTDFLALLGVLGIPEDKWRSSDWLVKNKHSSVYKSIHNRFDSWNNFLKFMGIKISQEEKKNWPTKLASCEEPEEFLALFRRENIPGDTWKNSRWLSENGHIALYRALMRDRRFASWKEFRAYMRGEEHESWNQKVAFCREPQDFLKFFKELGISVEHSRNSSWLRKNGFPEVFNAIMSDRRFGNWSTFLACLDGFLPMKGIHSEKKAFSLLRKEILRLRASAEWIVNNPKDGEEIRPEEWNEIRKPKYYENNIIVKTVADFLAGKVDKK